MALALTVIGSVLVLVGLASAFTAQKTLDQWARDSGRAPMVNTGGGSWSRYLRTVEAELPPRVRERIAVCDRICKIVFFVLVPIVFIGYAIWRNH